MTTGDIDRTPARGSTEHGIVIRTNVDQVSTYSRSTQGVNVMRVDDGDRVVAAMVLPSDDELDEITPEPATQADDSGE